MAERVLCVLVAAFGVACLVRARRAPASSRSPLAIGPRAERTAMLVVIGWVLLTRLVGATSPHQPRWYFSQVEPLHIADALARGHLGRQWLDLLKNVQVIWEHESPLQAPVATVMQLLLGPSIELPTFVGAVWAVLAVLLAWRLGRSIESPAFGVLFAALLAVSPLQTTWARLGGIYIGASAAVLFALWIGFRAGMRGSVAAAAVIGVVAWTAVYHYYAARVGMGLAFVASWAGCRRSGRGTGRLVALVTAAALGLGACVVWHRAVNPAQSLWPAYYGYVGSHGETSVQDWLASSAAAIRAQGERGGRAPRAIPAVVAPSRRFHFGECSMVVAGKDWIASYDQPRGVLFIYDRGGAALGRIPLARAIGTQPRSVHTIRAAGDYLGVGHDTAVTTLRVVRDPTCASLDAGEPE